MIPEVGHLSLIVSLAFAISLSIIPFLKVKNENTIAYSKPLAYGAFVFSSISFFLLVYSFTVDDFSVKYIAQHSNTNLPIYFKATAIWGGHEGSLLLWVFLLSVWTAAVAKFSNNIPSRFSANILAILAMVLVGFLSFTILTSNPFERLFWPNIPIEGRDLNPLLQDIGFIFHPPMIYMGYVGLSVSFAFVIAALLHGKLDSAWSRWARPWAIAAWIFLTLGNALGSWWAYYELGWGGWWFWDPVENASFVPWLISTALIHSLAITEKRGIFKNWTILLAILGFGLSLLGTFLVRSGSITSVHSFAADPSRGIFLLFLLAIAMLASLTLYTIKINVTSSFSRYAFYSRETAFLICNILLVIAASSVLLGTLYPMVIDILGYGKISVGPPFFNTVFIPIMSLLFIVMGIGPLIRWKKAKQGELRKQVLNPLIFSITFGLLFPVVYGGEFNALVTMGITLASWVFLVVVKEVFNQYTKHGKLTFSHLGMAFAHTGIAVTIVGVTIVSMYESEANIKMAEHDKVTVSGYEVEFLGVKDVVGANYIAEQGLFNIYKGDNLIAMMKPERRTYQVQTMGMTEAAIDQGLFRDIYIALGEPLSNNVRTVRIHYKPFIRWIWLGAIFMSIGGILSILDKRYRYKRTSKIKTSIVVNSLTNTDAVSSSKISEA